MSYPTARDNQSSFEAVFLGARREFSLNAFICGADMENTFVFIIAVDTLEQSGIETRAELKSHPYRKPILGSPRPPGL